MKRERTMPSGNPEHKLQPVQDHDRYSSTYSIPKALKFLSCVMSQTEIDIISRIIHLSSKYLDKGGCNLSNEILADRHECSKPIVSSAISKAQWLGLLAERKDLTDRFTDDSGNTFISQTRRLIMRIPAIWEIFGEIWAEFFFIGDDDCGKANKWAKERLTWYWKERENYPEWMRCFLEELVKSPFRGYFGNLTTPKGKLNDQSLETLRSLYSLNLNLLNKTSSSSPAAIEEASLSIEPHLPSNGKSSSIRNGRNATARQKELIGDSSIRYWPKEFIQSKEFRSSWQEWVEYRAAAGKPIEKLTKIGFRKEVARILKEVGSSPGQLIQAIDNAMARNWQGIWKPNGFNGNGKKRKEASEEQNMDHLSTFRPGRDIEYNWTKKEGKNGNVEG